MKVLLFFYEYFICVSILFVMTVFTALFTVVTIPWKNSEFVHKEQQLWSRLFFWLFFMNVEVEGAENIDRKQSYVFVGNHESAFDAWMVYGWLPNVFKWIMKAELRKVPFIGFGCAAAGHIFIDRTHVKAAKQSLEDAKKALTDGVSVVIFPEGTRSKDGTIGEFKRGAFQVAFELELPVVPITLNGTRNVMPRGAWMVNPAQKVKLTIGKPVDIRQYIAPEDADIPTKRSMQLEAIQVVRDQIIAQKEW